MRMRTDLSCQRVSAFRQINTKILIKVTTNGIAYEDPNTQRGDKIATFLPCSGKSLIGAVPLMLLLQPSTD